MEKQETKESKNLVIKNNEVAKFSDFNNVGEMLKFAQVLIDSKLVPKSLENPEAVVAVITRGKELGFEPMTALSNIHNIENKPTLGIHAISALLKKAGIKYKLIEDYVYLREDGGTDIQRKKDVKYIDIRTTITFYESFNDTTIENTFSFHHSEAKDMGLLGKYNWKNMKRIMMRNRCLAIGARFVAPETMLGMYETTELAETSNIDVVIDSDGNIIQD